MPSAPLSRHTGEVTIAHHLISRVNRLGGAAMRMVHWMWAVVLSVMVAATAAAQTQITTAAIDGLAMDASGGVLPGVNVVVKNDETNQTRSIVTDGEGRFVVLQLQPGRYT